MPLEHDSIVGDTLKPIEALPATQGGHLPRVDELLKGPENYTDWCNLIKWLFITYKVEHYVDGTIPHPDSELYPTSADNWTQNDALTCSIITSNIVGTQRLHTNPCMTSHEMWQALKAVHETQGHETVINYIRVLFQCSVDEGTDIAKHLELMKGTWGHINALGSEHFRISDLFFKIIIASSLPPSWDQFTENYIGGDNTLPNLDPRKQMNSQQFIRAIVSECARHKNHMNGTLKPESTNVATTTRCFNPKGKAPLINRISQHPSFSKDKENQGTFCKLCKKTTHRTNDCPH